MSHDDANGRNSGATFLIGFIAGSMLGAGLALLFAPKPGDETRREVAERAQRVKRQGARGPRDGVRSRGAVCRARQGDVRDRGREGA